MLIISSLALFQVGITGLEPHSRSNTALLRGFMVTGLGLCSRLPMALLRRHVVKDVRRQHKFL